MDDTQIIELYWQRDERAIDETEKKYGNYCFTVSYNILADCEDARECVNDTWFRTWSSIPPHRPGLLQYFLAKITRRLSLDRLKAKTTQKRGGNLFFVALDELSECLDSQASVEDAIDAKELASAVNSFLHRLPPLECNVFLRRYFFLDCITDIAALYRIKESYVSVLLSRSRKHLKKYLEQEGYHI